MSHWRYSAVDRTRCVMYKVTLAHDDHHVSLNQAARFCVDIIRLWMLSLKTVMRVQEPYESFVMTFAYDLQG